MFDNRFGRSKLEGLELAQLLVDSILDKKGENILLLDIREEAVFTDYFLICNGESDRQIKALADHIASDAKKQANILPLGTEGDASGGWVLLDFGDLIVHLFSPKMRLYYRLDELWSNGQIILRMQ